MIGIIILFGWVVAACSISLAQQANLIQQSPQPVAYSESPSLAAKVQFHQIPPLAERLPQNPMIVAPVERPGTYGGTWRMYDVKADFLGFRLINNYAGLTRWNADASGIIPGLAERWEFNAAGNEITVHLRRGVRWSNGDPFTTNDVMLWWQLCNDPRGIAAPPSWAYSQGELMTLDAPDSHTLRFTFAAPYYFAPLAWANGFWTPETMIIPSAYLKQFHPDYNREYPDFKIFLRKSDPVTNPDRPTLTPWMLTYYSETADRAIFERNPFYWAVDTQGWQLPYIDRVEITRVQSPETGILMIMAGNIDAQFRWIDLEDFALLRRGAKKGGYGVRRWETGWGSWDAGYFNMNQPDPERRELFRNQNFRAGLCYAVNRDKINQIIFEGLGRPQAAAITDEAWHFNTPEGEAVLQEWITRWSEYDPARANHLLDQAGLMQRDSDGMRLWNGKPFTFYLDINQAMDKSAQEAELIKDDFQAVGIRTVIRRISEVALNNNLRAGKFDMYLWFMAEMDLFTFPGYVFPTEAKNWHPLSGLYYATNGKYGEQPTGFEAELLEMYEAAKREPDEARRHQLVLDGIRLQLREGPFMLGTVGRQPSLIVVKDNFRNVPATGILGPWAITQPAAQFPEQFFIENAAGGEAQP